MCLRVSYKKKIQRKNIFFSPSLKSLKKGVGSGSIRQRYGYGSASKCHRSLTLLTTLHGKKHVLQQMTIKAKYGWKFEIKIEIFTS
jgi:hypothetical protein